MDTACIHILHYLAYSLNAAPRFCYFSGYDNVNVKYISGHPYIVEHASYYYIHSLYGLFHITFDVQKNLPFEHVTKNGITMKSCIPLK